MKIKLVSATSGIEDIYGGTIQLGLIVEGLKLTFQRSSGEYEAYVISLRDEVPLHSLSHDTRVARSTDGCGKSFSLGRAKALVVEGKSAKSDHRYVRVSIESPNVADFIDLFKVVYNGWLGIPHEVVAAPKRCLKDYSFVRGVLSDLCELRVLLRERWQRALEAAPYGFAA